MPRDILSTKSFKDFFQEHRLSEDLLNLLTAQGFDTLTKVQEEVIPHILEKKDVYIHAPTGSGKTLSYLIPAIELLRSENFPKNNEVGCLMLFPARELCEQTYEWLEPLAAAHGYTHTKFMGGLQPVSDEQIKRGGTFVAATECKIENIFYSDEYDEELPISNMKILIIDEADKILENFTLRMRLEKSLLLMPLDDIQIILASATISPFVLDIQKKLFKRDIEVVPPLKTVIPPCLDPVSEDVTQRLDFVVNVTLQERLLALISMLKALKRKKILVYFSSRVSVKFHYLMLKHFKLNAVTYSESVDEEKLAKITKSKNMIVLANGIVPESWDMALDYIVQYDPPPTPKTFFIRIGEVRMHRDDSEYVTYGIKHLIFLWEPREPYLDIMYKQKLSPLMLKFTGYDKELKQQISSITGKGTLDSVAVRAFQMFVRIYSRKKTVSLPAMSEKDICRAFCISSTDSSMQKIDCILESRGKDL